MTANGGGQIIMPHSVADSDVFIGNQIKEDEIVRRFSVVPMSLVLVITFSFVSANVFALEISTLNTPQLKPGWPVLLSGEYLRANPIAADINGDLSPELILTSTRSAYAFYASGFYQTFTFTPERGEIIVHAPVVGNVDTDSALEVVAVTIWNRVLIWETAGNLEYSWWIRPGSGFSSQEPTLADLNADGALDILLVEAQYWIHALRADGTELPGWPVNPEGWGPVYAAAAAGNLDNDPYPEVLVSVTRSFSVQLVVWNHDGSLYQPHSAEIPKRNFGDYTPTLADLNADSKPEIILQTSGYVQRGQLYVFDSELNLLPGWPHEVMEFYATRTSVADLDGDEVPEIVFGGQNMYAYRADGSLLPGFPWRVYDHAASRPYPSELSTPAEILIGNADADASPEFVVSVNEIPHAFDLDGQLVPGWPLRQDADRSFVVIDFDLDGLQELAFYHSYTDGNVFLYDIPAKADTCRWQWPMYRHDWLGSSSFTLPGPWRCRIEPTRYLFQQESLDID